MNEEQVFKALGYLLIAVIIYFAWRLSFDAARQKPLAVVLLKGAIWCAVVAFIGTVNLGNHIERCDDDPLYGTCDRAEDFSPTNTERIATFMYYLVLLYPPVVVGALQGARKMRHAIYSTNDA